MREWTECRLKDLVTFQKGRKVAVHEEPGYDRAPYLGAAVLGGAAPTEYAETAGAVLATRDDVLMLWDGERSGLVGRGRQGVVSSTVTKLTPRNGIVSEFLYQTLSSNFAWIQARRTGTGVPHVPKDIGRLLVLGHPTSIAEQRRIAEILSTIDDAIEQTEALIAKIQAIKAGLMHDLFTRGVTKDGQLRPPREEAPQLYKDSPLGWIPREWDVSTIGDCLLGIDAGHSPECPDTPASGDQWGVLKVGAVDPAGFRESQNKTVFDVSLRDPSLLVQAGDLLLSRANTLDLVGLICYVDTTPRNLMLSDKTLRLQPDSLKVHTRFLFWSAQLAATRRQIENAATGTSGSMKNISQGAVKKILFACPSLEEQRCLVERVDRVTSSYDALKLDAAKLRNIKRGLMHDLLTGQVGVSESATAKLTEEAVYA